MEKQITGTERPAGEYDVSGYRFFSVGELGRAHALAHRMLDAGQAELGFRRLGQWLNERAGNGSQWTHLQWHMMVFEIATQRWEAARSRFDAHLLPAATSTSDALTDAPAGLWRLRLAAPKPVELPWDIVRSTALAHLGDQRDRYVTAHHLLALAGAGDATGIEQWLAQHRCHTEVDRTLAVLAHALSALARADYATAMDGFAAALPGIPRLGGSRAQNELFSDLYRLARAGGCASRSNRTGAFSTN